MSLFLGDWMATIAPIRTELEQRLLPQWLPHRRWFQGKSRGIRHVRIVDGAHLWSVEDVALLLAYGEVATVDGGSSLYQIPLVVSRHDPGDMPGQARIGSLELACGLVHLFDGLAEPAIALWLLRLIGGGQDQTTEQGRLEPQATGALNDLIGGPSPEPIRLSGAEQSHSNVIFGDRLLLKVFRKLDAGQNPDLEIGQVLTERTAFRNMPRLGGSLLYRTAAGVAHASAMLQEFIPSHGQGWEWMLGLLGAAFEQAAEPGSDRARAHERVLADARLLGQRTAELHAALASIGDDPDFAPEPFTTADWQASRTALLAQAERTQASLAHLGDRPETLRSEAEAVLAAIPGWLDSQEPRSSMTGLGQKIRVHGDYHLGQTLRTESDYILLDFEGEPSKPIAERRRKQSPLRDVAGMLRSFDYAVYSALDLACRRHPERSPTFHAAAPGFRRAATAAFERSYLERAADAGWLPSEPAGQALLARLLVEKAMYELDYELNNRPEWATIPLRGLRDLVHPMA